MQIHFVIPASQVEAVSQLLELFLAASLTHENAGEDEFYEAAFPQTPDWQWVKLTGLFDARIDPAPIIDFIEHYLDQQGAPKIPGKIEVLAEQEWHTAWLEHFRPEQVGKALWVCPSWCQPVAPTERNIILDPGLAFGTGTHPTTRMCLEWLSRQDLSGQSVLDYGCGTGILGIAALLSNATSVVAADIDPMAVDAANENAAKNGFSAQFESMLPDQLPDQQFDIVIVNILANVIIDIKDTLLLHLAESGVLLLSGILDTQVNQIRNAFATEFSVYNKQQWSLLVNQKELGK